MWKKTPRNFPESERAGKWRKRGTRKPHKRGKTESTTNVATENLAELKTGLMKKGACEWSERG